MTAEALLSRLRSVRPRGEGRWSACCPAHEDPSPSLSLREAEDERLLVYCFAGCSVEAICAALGLRVADLFRDLNPDPQVWREAKRRREAARRKREAQEYLDGLVIDQRREAERFVHSARVPGSEGWSDEKRNSIMNSLADAYEALFDEFLEDEERAYGY